MPVPVIMPKLSMTMEQGVIVSWFKEEGARIEKGEPLLEVSTDKVNFEVESPASGILERIIAKPGDQIAVTETIALISQPDETGKEAAAPAPSAAQTAVAQPAAPAAPVGPAPPPPQAPAAIPPEAPSRPRATPAARRLAREGGVEISTVPGTGPGGAVTSADVSSVLGTVAAGPARTTQAPAAVLPAPPAERILPYEGVRKTIGDRMTLSQHTAPQLAMSTLVDFTAAADMRERLSAHVEAGGGPKLTYTDIIVKVAAAALRSHPKVNSSLHDDGIHVMAGVNVGVAVALTDGLVVPVIRQADRKGLAAIAQERAVLVDKARKAALRPEDVGGGTFTVSNIAQRDVDWFAPIINPPEAAILGIGRIAPRAVVDGDQVVPRLSAYFTLVFDHRVLDGADAAEFLQTLKDFMEDPALLLA